MDASASATPRPTSPPEPQPAARTDETFRSLSLDRVEPGVYLARNERGGELRFGSDSGSDFTPVELLLASIAGCTAVDVDHMTSRRAAPLEFVVTAAGHKVREDGGSIMRDLTVTFRVRFPDGPDGDAAREVLPTALQVSHDRSCTVSRTIEAGVPVEIRLA